VVAMSNRRIALGWPVGCTCFTAPSVIRRATCPHTQERAIRGPYPPRELGGTARAGPPPRVWPLVTLQGRARGYSVVEACNGEEALRVLGECLPEALLLDLGMPVLDGCRTVQKIRENPRWAKLPVLAVTAYAMQGDKERILSSASMATCQSRSIQRFFSKNLNVCSRPVAEKSLPKTEHARRVDRYELRHHSQESHSIKCWIGSV
jgi:CheY-like chemotaxis protein